MRFIRFLPLLVLLVVAVAPAAAFAYSSEWIGSGTASTSPIAIANPIQATGYFGQLTGEPQVFTVTSTEPFRLYVTALQPVASSSKKDISVAVLDPKHRDIPLGVILGPAGQWTTVSYQREQYYKAPDFRATLPAGTYEIDVWSSNNDAAYALIVGEKEASIATRFRSALKALPLIEQHFFGHSSAAAYRAPILLWPALLVVIVIAILIALGLRRRRETV